MYLDSVLPKPMVGPHPPQLSAKMASYTRTAIAAPRPAVAAVGQVAAPFLVARRSAATEASRAVAAYVMLRATRVA